MKSLKIIVVGDRGVGKTCLIRRYVDETFKENSHQTNGVTKHDSEEDDALAADLIEKRVLVNGREIVVSFWDQPSSPPQSSFFAGAHGCCIIFSTVDAESFAKLEFWHDHIKKYCSDHSPPPPVVIGENKIDLIDESVVIAAEVENIVKQYKLRLYRTSAKRGHQVDEMFHYITGKAAKFEFEQQVVDGSAVNGQHVRMNRALSAASWILPNDEITANSLEPSKRRTGGVKPRFNKNKCPVM